MTTSRIGFAGMYADWTDYLMTAQNKRDNFRARWFRVNAIKAHDGRWRQYPHGTEVSFHHYPEFDYRRGDVGDTIVWDSHRDRLIIQDDEKDYHALCYRERESKQSQMNLNKLDFFRYLTFCNLS